ncbi:MAG TPA: 16S rRNA (uracil(1498)-N(3))-methyltransferase [Sphingobacterium sp.]|uniref:16S rRNA (uracil(1498)-N(3))-methyltransferase n=1 Tax=Sphingobacterium sp. HMSC13C05 TaxID=1581095 RepID=UPI0008A2E903|nr:16S rRNA (uracil(1498)-N(3))-methyltransferase [Sphingobacterium sp. HMSC13C05]OFV12036.1 16S rRNA (uracil(1498)-N(3))-methyltransferase [Sphingobacterium sp. HMSC13C05]HAE67601.1 16S rRNA (uracil(1498)-N(3))-methyltransferase [Sphingobacterium sp.]
MQLFFTPDLNPSLENFILSEEESKHAIRVLRMDTGDRLHLIDGRGGLYEAQIIDPHPKRTVITILNVEEEFQRPKYHLHIAVGPTKNIDRIEWFLEKATEVGIQEITPVICEHSERKEVKLDRLNKLVVAAMKQSLKAYLPKLNPAVSFKQFLREIPTEGVQKAIAHCVDAEKKYLNQVLEPDQHYIILIGPEGDFSEEEIDLALQMGFHPISLGEARLRTETAALAACMEVSLLNRG